MKAFIMAAGEARRSWPYNEAMEKSLLPIDDGKPIIRIIVERLTQQAFKPEDICICILERYLDHFRHEFRDINGITYLTSEIPMGTASHYYSMVQKQESEGCPIVDKNEVVMIHYADSFIDLDYSVFINDFYKNDINKVLLAVTGNINHDYSEVKIDEYGDVKHFVEKPRLAFPTWTGVMLFRHSLLKDWFGSNLCYAQKDFAKDVITPLTEAGMVRAFKHEGEYIDLGTAHNYNKYKKKICG